MNQIGLEVIDLSSLKATLTQVLPKTNWDINAGVFTTCTTFFAATSSNWYSAFKDNIRSLTTYDQGILFTTD